MLAYDYPLLGMFWTLLWFFLWVAWIIILFRVFVDIFRSHDLGGWGKALWSIFVLIVPFLGVFIYLIARGHGMGARHRRGAGERASVPGLRPADAASTSGGGTADELAKLADLRDQGVITPRSSTQQKAKLLASV